MYTVSQAYERFKQDLILNSNEMLSKKEKNNNDYAKMFLSVAYFYVFLHDFFPI